MYIEEASEGSASDDVEGIEWRIYVKKRLLFIISILFLVTLLIPVSYTHLSGFGRSVVPSDYVSKMAPANW